jgi:hypothetical protein
MTFVGVEVENQDQLFPEKSASLVTNRYLRFLRIGFHALVKLVNPLLVFHQKTRMLFLVVIIRVQTAR